MFDLFKPQQENLSRRARRALRRESLRRRYVVNDSGTGNLAADTSRERSDSIWGRSRIDECRNNRQKGFLIEEDWASFGLIGTQTTEISANGGGAGWKVFNTGAGVVKHVSSINSVIVQGGALENSLDTDNDSGSIAQSYPKFRLSGDPTTSGPLFMEWCYTQNSVVTDLAAGFFGLAETPLWTLATGVPFNAGDPITNGAAALGFRITEDGLGLVDTVKSDRATSFTNVGDDEAGTMVAYTFAKYGMVYNPYDSANMITFYLNGVPLTTKISKTTLQATTNLKAGALGLILANCADSAGTSFKSYCKWVQCLQWYPGAMPPL